MILNLDRAVKRNQQKGYEKLYWCIDLHDAIIPGTYTRKNEGRVLYPYAEEVLKFLSHRKDMCLILWTSSHKDSVNDILLWLEKKNIFFDYVNENPECINNALCDFTGKFYFEVLIDDKAGWCGETDWKLLYNALKELGYDIDKLPSL